MWNDKLRVVSCELWVAILKKFLRKLNIFTCSGLLFTSWSFKRINLRVPHWILRVYIAALQRVENSFYELLFCLGAQFFISTTL